MQQPAIVVSKIGSDVEDMEDLTDIFSRAAIEAEPLVPTTFPAISLGVSAPGASSAPDAFAPGTSASMFARLPARFSS
jgi:hypothetical protein